MTQTYAQLQTQIARLQSEAEALRKSELAEVITKIRVAITAYGISPKDLFASATKRSAVLKVTRGSKSKADHATPKFADGQGNSWVGRGPRPLWLRKAIAAGKPLSDFAVDAPATSANGILLPSGSSKKTVRKSPGKVAKKKVAIKFRDEAGNSWSGRGSQPRWLREAVASGKTLDQLTV